MNDTVNEAALAATALPADAATLAADAAPSSTEPVQAVEVPTDGETGISEDAALSPAIAEAPVQIDAADHAEAQGVFESLLTKLENFEHALAADARADIEKIKSLLHL